MAAKIAKPAGAALAVVCALQFGLGRESVPATARADGPGLAAASARAERSIRGCANRNRRVRGVARLRPSRALARAARLHARNMARQGFFDHTDRQGRGVGERVAVFDRAGRFVALGENIAGGYTTPASACRGWMRSSGHRRNILNPAYTHVGGGFARGGPYRRYYVQVFGTPGGG